MLRMHRFKQILAVLIPACFISNPAYGISVGVSTDNAYLSENLNLDDSASFTGNTILSEGNIFHDKEATGSGNNEIQESIGGKGYLISSKVESSDYISTSSLSAATANSGIMSQETKASGDSVYIATSATSEENDMHVLGGCIGEGGVLDASLISASDGRAIIGGSASIAGVDCLDDSVLGNVATGNIAMSTEGLYAESEYKRSKGDVGYFGILAINNEKLESNLIKNDDRGTVRSDQEFLTPSYTASGGSIDAYKLPGWRWNALNPQIKMYLRYDTNLKNEKLDPIATGNAVLSATKTWEAATSKNLFADSSTVVVSTTKTADKYDGSNVIAFKPLSSASVNALAYTRTYYATTTKVGGYYSAVESDISFNTRFNWETAGTGAYYDFQSVVLHELGHTLGLGDIYNDPILSADKMEVMNSYSGVKRTLGNGDKTAIWTLYG